MKKENKYRKVLTRSISFIMLLIFLTGLVGMTYLDGKSIQKEMETKISSVASKSKKMLHQIVHDGEFEENYTFRITKGMADIQELVDGTNIGFYYTYSDMGDEISESGNIAFFHMYETYQDEDGDKVYVETLQKMLRLDDYFTKEELAEYISVYQQQEERATIAVEGVYKGDYILPERIVMLGWTESKESIPKDCELWKADNGNKFYAEDDDENYYYILKEKICSESSRPEYDRLPEQAIIECDLSFIGEQSQDGLQDQLKLDAKNKLKNGDGKEKNSLMEISKMSTIELEDGREVSYCLIGKPMKVAVEHLRFFYVVAMILYIVIAVFVSGLIREVFKRQEEIEQSQKMLTRAIAHELKTPLSIIQGYCEGMKLQKSEEKKAEYLDTIVEETREMNQLVLDMLELSKLETHGYSLELEEIELVELVSAVKGQYKNLLAEKNISLEFEGEKDLFIEGDVFGMGKIISNLISNGIKHAPENGLIKITFEEEKGYRYIRFYNNGEKMDEKVRKGLWDGYYKTNEENTSMLRNTGLGLTIVKHLVDLHKFEVGCENKEVGVEFWIKMKQKPQRERVEQKENTPRFNEV